MGEMKTVNKDTVTISKEAPPLERSSTFVDGEDEKERTIAKAALSIAELGTHPHLDTSVSEHSSEIALVTLLDESQQSESATSNPDQSFSPDKRARNAWGTDEDEGAHATTTTGRYGRTKDAGLYYNS